MDGEIVSKRARVNTRVPAVCCSIRLGVVFILFPLSYTPDALGQAGKSGPRSTESGTMAELSAGDEANGGGEIITSIKPHSSLGDP